MARKLGDLYVRGKELVFDDGAGDPIAVWIQKLNPVQQEQAQKYADSKRAKVLTLAKLPNDAAEKEVFMEELDAMCPTKADLIDLIISEDVSKALQSAEAEVAEREEWSQDGYLTGLQEAWESGVKETIYKEEDPGYAEAQRIFAELKKFSAEVDAIVETEAKRLKNEYAGRREDTLKTKCLDKLIRNHADRAWIIEYRKCEVWLAVRDPEDHRKLYFEDRSEVDDLEIEVLTRLINEYSKLLVPPTEGKD